MATLSSLLLSNPHQHNYDHDHHRRRFRHAVVSSAPVYLPVRSIGFSTKATQQNNRPTEQPIKQPSSPPEKKSFAVATGELFLGIASRIISTRANSLIKDGEGGEGVNGLGPGVTLLPESGQAETWWRNRSSSKERIASVVEDPVQPEVVWEQRVKDVEAERGRTAVTSPGFSFSAAGLLFPYHLGVAQLLIEKGYIKDTTPLAGASAGAIVCATIASGAFMSEALKATKILAADCRLNGTAFRLGVC